MPAHLKAFRANTVDARFVYIGIRRGRLYKQPRPAIDETLMRKGATITIPKSVRTMEVAIGG